MITLVFTGKCEKCKFADLSLDAIYFGDESVLWTVKCSHDAACEHIKEQTIQRFIGDVDEKQNV